MSVNGKWSGRAPAPPAIEAGKGRQAVRNRSGIQSEPSRRKGVGEGEGEMIDLRECGNIGVGELLSVSA